MSLPQDGGATQRGRLPVIHISTLIHNSRNRRPVALSRGPPSETPRRVCPEEAPFENPLISYGPGAPRARNRAWEAAKRRLDGPWVASVRWRVVRILVIDDQPDVARVVAEVLASEGHQALVAGSGEEGLRLIEQNSPDAVFLDVVMPGIDGIEVLRRIRATRPDLPVILLSGTVNQRQMETAMELGVTDVLRKPAPLTHFTEALARVRPA